MLIQRKQMSAMEALTVIGFSCYRDYLESRLWKRIRRRILERDGGKCVICDQPAEQVHHRSYGRKVMLGQRNDQLFSLCRSCHEYVEFENGVKVSHDQARRRFDKWMATSRLGNFSDDDR